MTPHAIPTTYAGRRFRSRLEARWCLTFDLYGWSWRYEPSVETRASYLPDFWLPGRDVYVEVKYGSPLPIFGESHDNFLADLERLDRDDARWRTFVADTATDLWIVVGEPVRWIEGIPARPAWGLVYCPHTGTRHLAVWSDEGGTPGPSGTVRRWTLGPTMLDAARAVRDYSFGEAEAA